jgi:hypothetical protein
MTEQPEEPHMDLVRFVVTQSGKLDVYTHPIFKQINPHQRIRLATVIKNVGEDILQRAVAEADALAEDLEKGDGGV